MSGYLFVYFEGTGDSGRQEHIRYALSEDAVRWRALNGNQPVIDSDTISDTGGVRDPHILRAENGEEFLMVATDMNTARDGWNAPNPGIVMMRSRDLINWSSSVINLSKAFPEHFCRRLLGLGPADYL